MIVLVRLYLVFVLALVKSIALRLPARARVRSRPPRPARDKANGSEARVRDFGHSGGAVSLPARTSSGATFSPSSDR